MLSENLIVRLSVCPSVRDALTNPLDYAELDRCVAVFVMNLIEH
jgi:hypothetical protein